VRRAPAICVMVLGSSKSVCVCVSGTVGIQMQTDQHNTVTMWLIKSKMLMYQAQ